MPGANLELNPPIQYSLIWLLIGAFLLLCIVSWYAIMFLLTRRKAIKSLADLGPGVAGGDLEALKQKYLKLIDECYQRHQQKQTTLRRMHYELSMTVRYFVYETKHFPAPRLTLADIKRAPYPELAKLIEEYYDKEFAMIEHGEALRSVEAAKGLVQRWV